MSGTSRPSEDHVITEWVKETFDSPQAFGDNAGWFCPGKNGNTADVVIREVPIKASHQSTPKRIDLVVLHGLPFQSLEQLRTDTIDAWSIAEPPNLANPERFTRNLLSFQKESGGVSLYEAKVSLNFAAFGQILNYTEFFPEYYPATNTTDIHDCGIIYWESDNMGEQMAERLPITLRQVTLSPVEFDDENSDFSPDKLDERSGDSSEIPNTRPALTDPAAVERRFPQPNLQEEFLRLESYRLNHSKRLPPGVFFDRFASEILDENILLTREEFVNAEESSGTTGIGR